MLLDARLGLPLPGSSEPESYLLGSCEGPLTGLCEGQPCDTRLDQPLAAPSDCLAMATGGMPELGEEDQAGGDSSDEGRGEAVAAGKHGAGACDVGGPVEEAVASRVDGCSNDCGTPLYCGPEGEAVASRGDGCSSDDGSSSTLLFCGSGLDTATVRLTFRQLLALSGARVVDIACTTKEAKGGAAGAVLEPGAGGEEAGRRDGGGGGWGGGLGGSGGGSQRGAAGSAGERQGEVGVAGGVAGSPATVASSGAKVCAWIWVGVGGQG